MNWSDQSCGYKSGELFLRTRLSSTLSGLLHLRFKLKTLFLLVTLVALVFAAPSIWHQVQLLRLKSYANRNLGTLEEHERLTVTSIVDSVLKRESQFDSFDRGPLPWFLWSRPNGNYVFLELIPMLCSHSNSHARVTIFDDNGRLLNEVQFQTGYSLDVEDAERITLESTAELVFAIDSIPAGGPVDLVDGRYCREKQGRGIRRQYYAVIDNQPVLLRLEGIMGNSMPNGADHFKIGPESTESHDPMLINRLKSELATRLQATR